jgi:uncharacterized membrane protein
MSKQRRWLLSEIDKWKYEGLVSAEQAAALRSRYPEDEGGAPWGLLLFASAASVAIGLGIILLIAYNWDKIPKFGKLGLVLGALGAAHGSGARFLRSTDWKRHLGEALCLLGTIAFGAGIFLVAQIYHIDEHFPDGFFIWACGALAFAWALDSVPQALAATVLFTVWSGADIIRFERPVHWAFAWILLGVGPMAWRLRSAPLLVFVLASTNLVLIFTVFRFGSTTDAISALFAFGALLVAAAKITRQAGGRLSELSSVFGFFGYAGVILCAYFLSFELRFHNYIWSYEVPIDGILVKFAYSWTLFSLSVVAWLLAGLQSARAGTVARHPADWIVPLSTVLTFALFYGGSASLRSIGGHTYSLVLLVIAVSWMWRGSRSASVRNAVLGSVLLAVLIIARYFDLFDSLASRGGAFLALGMIFIAEAAYFRKNRARAQPEREAAP